MSFFTADGHEHNLVRAMADVVRDRDARTAVVDGQRTLSFRELDRMATDVCSRLTRAAPRGSGRIAVFAERRAELYPVLLGAVRHRVPVVPLNTAHPAPALRAVLEAAGVGTLVHDLDEAPDWMPATVRALRVDELCAPDPDPVRPDDVAGDPDDVAFVLFTSGSSGAPRGVEITRRGLGRLAADGSALGVTPADRFLQLADMSFAASTNEIWLPLLNGAGIVPVRSRWPSPQALLRTVRRHGVTVASLPCGLFDLLVEHEPDVLRALRAVLVSGDTASPARLSEVASWGTTAVYHGFGCTENSSISTVWRVPAEGADPVGRLPIGDPLPTVTLSVRDPDTLEPCAAGTPGDLCLGGAGLAAGYLDDPGQTADRFVHPPDGTGRVLRTGDVAVVDGHGSTSLLGRRDGVVKVRGFRVETAAVERALLDLDGVREAAVVATGGHDEESALTAHVVPDGPRPPDRLAEPLRERLPDYMVPSTFVATDALPRNTNGKIDRRALRRAAMSSTSEGDRLMATSLEDRILEIWKGVVRVEDVSTTDPFLSQGASSLNFVQFSSALQKQLDLDVEPEDVFRHGTVERLARHLEGASAG